MPNIKISDFLLFGYIVKTKDKPISINLHIGIWSLEKVIGSRILKQLKNLEKENCSMLCLRD